VKAKILPGTHEIKKTT